MSDDDDAAIHKSYSRLIAMGHDPEALDNSPGERRVFRDVLRTELHAYTAALEGAEEIFAERHGRGPIAELDADMSELVALANREYTQTREFREALEPVADMLASSMIAELEQQYGRPLTADEKEAVTQTVREQRPELEERIRRLVQGEASAE